MRKDARTLLSIIVGVVIFALFLIFWLIYTESRKRKTREIETTQANALVNEGESQRANRDESIPVGDVNVDLSMDYAKLKSIFHDKGRSEKGLYKNAVTLEWDGISAIFLGTSDFPEDSQKPVSLWPSRSFQGSVCGIHLGDSVEKARSSMRVCGCRITKTTKQGDWFQVSGDCRSQGLLMNMSGGRIESVEISDRNYVTTPAFR